MTPSKINRFEFCAFTGNVGLEKNLVENQQWIFSTKIFSRPTFLLKAQNSKRFSEKTSKPRGLFPAQKLVISTSSHYRAPAVIISRWDWLEFYGDPILDCIEQLFSNVFQVFVKVVSRIWVQYLIQNLLFSIYRRIKHV